MCGVSRENEMSTAYPPFDANLAERLDALELRVQQLEDDSYEVETATDHEPELSTWGREPATIKAEEPTPRATVDHDLRELQRAATNDLPQQPASPQSEPGHVFDMRYVEERLAGRVLAIIGGVALTLGAVFFLSLAFSRGWINPGLQVGLGLAGGALALLIGGFLLLRGERIVGHVLTAVGLAVISLAFFAAITLYDLLPPIVGLAGTLAAAGAATLIAVASRSQVVAAFGLVAVLAAPPLLEAPADLLALAYMVIVLGGVAVVSLRQTWSWLPILGFLLSAPQVWAWVTTGPELTLGFGALLVYWALLAIASGGEAYVRPGAELSPISAPLFLLSGAFVVVMAFGLVTDAEQRAVFLLSLGALHGAIALFFVTRRGPVAPFGLLAGGYGVALASAAVPLLLGAPLTAGVWAAEAAALAFLAGRRAHGPSLLAALALFSVASLRVAYVAYDAYLVQPIRLEAVVGPLDTLMVSWLFMVAIGAAFILAVPVRTVRLTVASILALLSTTVVFYELTGVAEVAGWTLLAVAVVTSPRWLARLPERRVEWQLGPALDWLRPSRSLLPEAEAISTAVAALIGAFALAATAWAMAAQNGRPDVPFSDAAGLSALIVSAGFLAAGLLSGDPRLRRGGIIASGVVLGVAAVFQMPLLWAAVLWTVGAGLAFVLGRTDRSGLVEYAAAGAVALGAVVVAALVIAPPNRLVVSFGGLPPHPPFASEASLVWVALVVGLLLGGLLHRDTARAGLALACAGVAALYLVSIGVVDLFAGEAYGPPTASLQRSNALAKEAHVALSILWSIVGLTVMAVGLLLGRSALRLAGLAVLGLATAKVFLFDLASLDIAYRVITLLVLGTLLVAAAWVWTRLNPSPAEPESTPKSGTTTESTGAGAAE